MRRAAALTALLGAGLLTGHALADGPPLPPLPSITSLTSIVSVTSSLPSVPAPPPVTSAPSVPAPTVQTPLPAGTVPTTAAPANSIPSAPAGASTATSAGHGPGNGPTDSSAQPQGGSGGGETSGAQIARGRSSRTWISTTGPRRRRTTILAFVLPRAARVVFVVRQLAPVCRLVSRFTVAGHPGVNRVRFPRRTSPVTLEAGTYRISGRTRKGGRLVQRAIVVVVDGGAPTTAELDAARVANACVTPGAVSSFGRGATFVHAERPSSPAGQPSANGPGLRSDSVPGGVLGSTAAKAAREIRPVLVALLGLAIVLLGIASLPKLAFVDQRANDLLARHRIEIAGLGAAAFIAVVISFLIG